MFSKNVENTFSLLNKNLKKVEKIVVNLISFISLFIIYILGVGLTSLVAKVVQKQFLGQSDAKSQWVKVKYSTKFNNQMY